VKTKLRDVLSFMYLSKDNIDILDKVLSLFKENINILQSCKIEKIYFRDDKVHISLVKGLKVVKSELRKVFNTELIIID
jgi:hypothetical protein